jgi:hypothetical protein
MCHTHLQLVSERLTMIKYLHTFEGKQFSGFNATHNLSPPASENTSKISVSAEQRDAPSPDDEMPLVMTPPATTLNDRNTYSTAVLGEKSRRGI